jgi:GT2 family glycosyltransferase
MTRQAADATQPERHSTRATPPEGHSAHAKEPDVSVIVVTHNNEALIGRCLNSIAGAVGACSHEVIVVDNGSTDGTLAVVADEQSAVRSIALDANIGFARANNIGIDASRGRLIALVNSDAFPDPGSIERLVEAIDQLARAAIVGGRLRYPTGELQPSHGRFPSLLGGLWVALFLHRMPLLGRSGLGVAAHPTLYRTRCRVDWVTAAFCIARREAGHVPIGRFMYGEDVEWALASRRAGLEVWLEPASTAIHVGRASVERSRERGFAQRQRVQFELAWFARRGPLARLGLRAVLIVHAVLRLAVYGGLATMRHRPDSRVVEYRTLLHCAFTERVPRR